MCKLRTAAHLGMRDFTNHVSNKSSRVVHETWGHLMLGFFTGYLGDNTDAWASVAAQEVVFCYRWFRTPVRFQECAAMLHRSPSERKNNLDTWIGNMSTISTP